MVPEARPAAAVLGITELQLAPFAAARKAPGGGEHMPTKLGGAGAAHLCVLLAAAANGAQAATDYPALVRALSAAVAAKDYDPHLHGADWPAVTRRAEMQARDVHSDAGFKRLAQEIFSALKSSHLVVDPPRRH